jgi:hypothetical protein
MVRFLWLVWHLITHRWTRYVAAWLMVLGIAAHAQYFARHIFDAEGMPQNPQRRDGNSGHTAIDFGGQWLMGRMLVLGYGHELYNRRRQYEVAQRAFPYKDEVPDSPIHDADEMLSAFMDSDYLSETSDSRENRDRYTYATFPTLLMAGNAFEEIGIKLSAERWWTPERLAELKSKHVGGPLYPPIQAFLLAPLAQSDTPQRSYFIMQWIMLGMAFLAGMGISVLTRARIWWPMATAMILLFPGFSGGHQLGQNPAFSLAILVWGWALMSCGFEVGGGMVWGLFAYKPPWGLAFLLALLVTRRWRACLGMFGVGCALVLATLPFVGIETWLDWLKVGDAANRIYNVDDRWIPLSRDIINFPKRFLIDLNERPYFGRDRWFAHFGGWLVWVIIVEATVRLTQLFPARFRSTTGPAAAFVLLASWMSCFHFMYYDVLQAALGFLAVLDPPANIFRRKFVTFQPAGGGKPLDQAAIDWYRPRLARFHPGLSGAGVGKTWVANSFLIYLGIALLIIQHTLPWMRLGITATALRFPLRPSYSDGKVVVKDGKTVMRARELHIDADWAGIPADTLCMVFLWVWCGIVIIIRRDEKSADSS